MDIDIRNRFVVSISMIAQNLEILRSVKQILFQSNQGKAMGFPAALIFAPLQA